MRVCVIGGTGNISRSIVQRLLALGHEVAVYNRGRQGAPPQGVQQITGDRADRPAFEARLRRERFDAAIDMLCFTPDDARSSLQAFPQVGHLIVCSTVTTYGIQFDRLPVREGDPLRPVTAYGRDKAAADEVFLAAYRQRGYPVTIVKPSTTYGPLQGLIRQVAWDYSWIDRIRKGKPLVVCGDGGALHQHLHVNDAALGFAGLIGLERAFGETYNLVDRGSISWAGYHRTAMRVLGRQVDLVGVPLEALRREQVPDSEICEEIFAHDTVYDAEKIFRHVPDFRPAISLEQGMRQVIAALERSGRIPDSDQLAWEDALVARFPPLAPAES